MPDFRLPLPDLTVTLPDLAFALVVAVILWEVGGAVAFVVAEVLDG